MNKILITALVAIFALAPINVMAADLAVTSADVGNAASDTPDLLGLGTFFRIFGIALSDEPLTTGAANQEVAAMTPPISGIERPAFVELGMYIQSGQIRSASILDAARPFYVNDDPSPVSATIWVTPRDLAIRPVGVVDIPVKRGIDLSLSNVPTEANIVILVGSCNDLSFLQTSEGKGVVPSTINTYTSAEGLTDAVAVIYCPQQ